MEESLNVQTGNNSTTAFVPEPLPYSTVVLVLGILSIALCWCYGIIGVVLAIIALVLGSKGKKLYKQEPEKYQLSSYKNLNAGYICAIIGLILSGLYLIFIIIYLFIVGSALSTAFSTFPWDAVNY